MLYDRKVVQYAAEKYPKLKWIDPPQYPGENQQKAYEATQGLLKSPDPPDGIFGITSVSCPAAAKAVRDLGFTGKVAVSGLALPSAMRTYVKDGTAKEVLLWNPENLGYLAVYAAHLLQNGTLTRDSTEIEAGSLGKLKVRGGEIILGPPLIFDKNNIDDLNF